MALVTQAHECAHPGTPAPSACFNEVCNLPLIKLGACTLSKDRRPTPLPSTTTFPKMSNSGVLPPAVVLLIPLAIKEQPVIDAERYISAVGLSIFVYDLLLTFGDEVRYIWRPPISSIKVLYLILRYGVAIGQLIYFQAISGLVTAHLSHSVSVHCVGTLIVLALVGSLSIVLANSFVTTSIVQLAPHVVEDPYIFHMCLIIGRTPYWIGIWLSQALFDVFLFVLTITNAASRPRRANVKIITDLRRDGCVFYLLNRLHVPSVGRFLNVALSIPTDVRLFTSFVLSLSTVMVTRLVLRVERILVTRGSGRDLQVPNWMYNSYELQSTD
ncbi:hypothetical protein H4582DRAFT_1930244 [Lactarius indigo]|nr:hypothetical protein H4582DRAFT_1930244 [Lactarius indigo]